jgi:hypothetical protein
VGRGAGSSRGCFLREEIAHYCAVGARFISQARRRALDGEQLPTSEKIYSISEPHTDLIKRGKVRASVCKLKAANQHFSAFSCTSSAATRERLI